MLTVRQARVQFSARHTREDFPTEPILAIKRWRGTSTNGDGWLYILYECDGMNVQYVLNYQNIDIKIEDNYAIWYYHVNKFLGAVLNQQGLKRKRKVPCAFGSCVLIFEKSCEVTPSRCWPRYRIEYRLNVRTCIPFWKLHERISRQ